MEGPFAVVSLALDQPSPSEGFTPVLEGPLRVLSATPYGTSSAAPGTSVSVTFSQPMTALGAETLPPEVLRLDPAVPSTVRWLGTQTLVLTPSSPLQPATVYAAVLESGLVSIQGDTLREPVRWTFETVRPQVRSAVPQAYATDADPDAPLRVTFNLPVDASQAAAFVTLTQRSGRTERPRPIQLENDGDSTLVITPRTRLDPDTRYELSLREGLPATSGALGLAATASYPFTTYAPLAFEGVTQAQPWAFRNRTDVDPGRSITLRFTTPIAFGEVRRGLTFEPAIDLPVGLEARDGTVSRTHSLSLPLAPESAYRVTVRDLTDAFGQRLSGGLASFRTRAFAPTLRAPQGLLVVEAEEQARFAVQVTNVETVRVGAERLTESTLVPRLPSYDPYHYYGDDRPEADPVDPVRAWAPPASGRGPTSVPFAFDSLLTDQTGVFGYVVEGPTPAGATAPRRYHGLVQATRLGVTAKFSPHQNLVFVTDLATGSPQPGVTIRVRDQANEVRWEGVTDAQGQALTPGWSQLGLTADNPWERPFQFVTASQGSDVAFTSSLYEDGLEPYRFDVDYAWWSEAETVAGSVFSDRGLYRTGETVHLKGILRRRTDADWEAVRDSVRVLLVSPRDEIVHDLPVSPSALGTLDTDWSIPATAAQGAYTVRLVAFADTAATERESWEQGDLARGTFRVDAFRRATFAVSARSQRSAYVAGDFFEGSVEGRYLFGADMRDQPVRYQLTTTPRSYQPPGYDGYRFGSFSGGGAAYQTLLQADTRLGGDGRAEGRVALPNTTLGIPLQLRWAGTVTNPARQEETGQTTALLHPALHYIGLKPQTTFLDLDRSQSLTVDLVTVDPAGAPVGDLAVTVELIRQQWNSVREVGTDGRLRWRSERIEEAMGQQTLVTEAGRLHRLTLPVEAGGSYQIRATSSDVRGNVVRTEAYVYAAGSGYTAWERRDDDRIDLVADKASYAPGETARILIASPYDTTTALITLEREGILESWTETLKGTTPQVEIPLTEAHLPNVFVSVVLIQGRRAPPDGVYDGGAPAFKMGLLTLPVDPGTRRLDVSLTPDASTYGPGDEVTVALQLRDATGAGVAGEVALSVADAGVLNRIGYALPDPFDAFYGPRPLRVTTSETRAHLVRQRSFGQKEEDLGGGGSDDAQANLRTDFRPSAYWNPAIRTDAQGRAEVTFRLPESLTTFRMMAAAVSARAFGQAQTDVTVTQDLVLQPALPRIARRGDEFEAGVLVTNTTDRAGSVTVTASADVLQRVGPAESTLPLPAGATREVRFDWQAPEAGSAALRFSAVLDDGLDRPTDALEVELEVQPPTLRQTAATFASTGTSAQEMLQRPANAVPGLGRLVVRAAPTALTGLDGAATYLFGYPYGCLEQRTSRIRPLIIADDLIEAFELDLAASGLGTADRAPLIEDWLDRLDRHWTGQGFALWPGSNNVDAYTTAYVLLALAEAQEAGFEVPLRYTTEGLRVVEERARARLDRPSYYSTSVWNDTRALMLYALSLHGRVLTDEIQTLTDAALVPGAALGTTGESYLLQLLVATDEPLLVALRDRLAERLRGRLQVEATQAYLASPEDPAYGWIFESDVRTTAHGLRALLAHQADEAFQPLAERMVRYLMQQRTQGHWASTQENIAVLEALQAYYEAYEQAEPALRADLTLGTESVLTATFSGRQLQVTSAERPLAELAPGPVPLDIQVEGTGRLYYSVLLDSYVEGPVQAADDGFRVQRSLEVLDDQGQPLRTLPPGDAYQVEAGSLLRITLTLSTGTNRHHVVLDDALPAGLEALNQAFITTDAALADAADGGTWWGSFNHHELRDDRVVLFADYLLGGEHTYRYLARATTPGTFVYPPAQSFQMYRPEVSGRTASSTFTVVPPPSASRSPQ